MTASARRIVSIGLALAAVLLGIPATSPVAAQSTLSCGAAIVPSPNVGTGDNFLNAVSVLSPTNAWAVGWFTDAAVSKTLILHWDGEAWATSPSPNPGRQFNQLDGVSARSADDAWAVGFTGSKLNGSDRRALTLHWDGSSWSEVPVRNSSGAYNELLAVRAVAPDDVWAVGDSNKPDPPRIGFESLVLHWNGLRWRSVPSPNRYDPDNGSNDNYLWSADAASPSDVWAVGNFGDYDNQDGSNSTLAMRGHRSGWHLRPTPNPSVSNYLRSVSVQSAAEIWVGGYSVLDRYSMPRPLVAVGNGRGWSIVPTDPLPDMTVLSMEASSPTWVWVGGSEGNGDFFSAYPIVALWDGTAWSVVSQHDLTGSVNGVAADGSGGLWAVGSVYDDVNRTTVTLTERVTCA
jgi:hypothetical protein